MYTQSTEISRQLFKKELLAKKVPEETIDRFFFVEDKMKKGGFFSKNPYENSWWYIGGVHMLQTRDYAAIDTMYVLCKVRRIQLATDLLKEFYNEVLKNKETEALMRKAVDKLDKEHTISQN